jgi:membrane protein
MINRLKAQLRQTIWEVDLVTLPRWHALLVRSARVIYAVMRDLADGQLTLHAMGLVYTTLLSLVPLLAVSFSVLQGFGVHNQAEPLLLNFLEPLGEKGREITHTVIGFVEKMKVGVLGSLGLALLMYTVISLIQKVERALGSIWHVKKPRPLAQRFSNYLSVILIGPVLVFSALGTSASLMSTSAVQTLVAIEPLGWLAEFGAKLVPYFLIIAAFTFVYSFLPNTRVRLGAAFTGAVVAGLLWQTIGWGFAAFVVTSTKYTAIYSGFAILILFMMWLYLAWLILLVGASIAFYHQNPEYLRQREFPLSNRLKERLALQAIQLIGRSHYGRGGPWTTAKLAQHLKVPEETIVGVLSALKDGGLVVTTNDHPAAYVPARSLDSIPLAAVLDTVRIAGEHPYLNLDCLSPQPHIDRLTARIDAAVEQTLQSQTLKDLALEGIEVPLTEEPQPFP